MNLTFFTLKYLSMYNMTYKKERHLDMNYIPLPDELDWRDSGMVGPVRRQGACNSCWAFSAAGSIEYHARRQMKEAEVSVQSILDCSKRTFGCNGGLMGHVFEYTHPYPLHYDYSGHKKKCTVSSHGAKVEGFVVIRDDIEHVLPYLITKWGPTSVGVDFDGLETYRGGIVKEKDCGKTARHAVLVVGYTKDAWIVKNSQGAQWGDKGYALVERGTNACAIDSTYAAVATEVSLS